MRDIFTADTNKLLESFYRSVHYLNELEDRQTSLEYFETMIRYLMGSVKKLTKHDMENIIREVEQLFLEGSDLAMTLADVLREEGLQQGIQQGMQQGMEKGKSEALAQIARQLLFKKFGKLPEDIQTAILNADSSALEMLLLDIFTIEEIDEVRKYL